MSRLSEFIWFEKYRPTKLDDVSLNKEHKKAFSSFIQAGEIPHLLLEGPQGSGKTTVAYILMGSIPCVTLTLNASGQDRGIDTVKTKIKQFAASKAPTGKIKIVLLDEADALTRDAQTALRNTMETYSRNCRFILTCNYVDKVIPPIQSRCMKFTFNQFPKRKLVLLCQDILKLENIEGVTDTQIADVVDKFYPDMRSVIQTLQAACLSGSFNEKAISAVVVDPSTVCKAILTGNIFTVRKLVAGVTDFTYLYRYLIDHFIPDNGDATGKALMIDAIGDAVRFENTVPDREINFVQCVNGICDALDIELRFTS